MITKRKLSKQAELDLSLVSRAREFNDEKAFSQLMLHYKKSVYFIGLKMVRNKNDAEDLTIEAFTKAFKNLHKYNPDFNFSTWLFRIATNNCIDFIRKKKLNTTSLSTEDRDDPTKTIDIDLSDSALNPLESAIREEKILIMRKFVEKLPDKFQQIIDLRYFQEMSYVEIAEETGTPLGTVKARLHRARELLLLLVKDVRYTI